MNLTHHTNSRKMHLPAFSTDSKPKMYMNAYEIKAVQPGILLDFPEHATRKD